MHRKKARTLVKVSVDLDLVHDTGRNLPLIVFGGLSGYLGSTFMAFAIAIALQPLPANYLDGLFITTIVAGTAVFAWLGAKRDSVVKRIAKRGFAFTYWSQRLLGSLFWVGVVVASYAILAVKEIVPSYHNSLPQIFAGLYFWLAMPRWVYVPLISTDKEGRLCMTQFILTWNSGNPERSTGHSWLRRSLQRVEQQLRGMGISPPPRALFLGASYSIFMRTISNIELEEIGDWIVERSNRFDVNLTIPYLLSRAEDAEKVGFGKTLGVGERLLRLPWEKVNGVRNVILLVSTVVAFVYQVLKLLHLIP